MIAEQRCKNDQLISPDILGIVTFMSAECCLQISLTFIQLVCVTWSNLPAWILTFSFLIVFGFFSFLQNHSLTELPQQMTLFYLQLDTYFC